jgi:hypothetical protein
MPTDEKSAVSALIWRSFTPKGLPTQAKIRLEWATRRRPISS